MKLLEDAQRSASRGSGLSVCGTSSLTIFSRITPQEVATMNSLRIHCGLLNREEPMVRKALAVPRLMAGLDSPPLLRTTRFAV